MDVFQAFINTVTLILVAFISWKLNSQQSLRMAVVEKRFQAHQEAYRFLVETILELQKEDPDMNLVKAHEEASHEWWKFNCLYLDEECNQAFTKSMTGIIYMYSGSLTDHDQVKANIQDAMDKLADAVDLPPLTGVDKLWRI